MSFVAHWPIIKLRLLLDRSVARIDAAVVCSRMTQDCWCIQERERGCRRTPSAPEESISASRACWSLKDLPGADQLIVEGLLGLPAASLNASHLSRDVWCPQPMKIDRCLLFGAHALLAIGCRWPPEPTGRSRQGTLSGGAIDLLHVFDPVAPVTRPAIGGLSRVAQATEIG